MEYSETRYLASKKTVEDRSLNKFVLERLRDEITLLGEGPLRIIEVGAGLGTMVARLLDWQLIKRADYTLLDVDGESLRSSRSWLTTWAQTKGLVAIANKETLTLRGPGQEVVVRAIEAEVRDFLTQDHALAGADLLVANAFLDLVDVPQTLPALFKLLRPDGLYYFTINFDGETIFQPDHPLDKTVLDVYHLTMDERIRYGQPAGDARSGRHLFGNLRQAGARILAVGSSDWVVMTENERYLGDEMYFIEHILHTVETALSARPAVTPEELSAWLTTRRQQLASGELVYIAHQLDFVGSGPRASRR